MLLALALAKPHGDDVHRPDADCAPCHAADAGTLRADPARARNLLATDLEQRCSACHGDEGPSHPTGMAPRQPVPDTLPLSRGRITCGTCHFLHGESNRFGDLLRLDNERGGLCLTCHQLSELQ